MAWMIQQVRNFDGSPTRGDYMMVQRDPETGRRYTHPDDGYADVFPDAEWAQQECDVLNDRAIDVHGSTRGTEAGLWGIVPVGAGSGG